jgi:hypothetical protein
MAKQQQNEDVEQYWREKEQELGEPILMRTIAHAYAAAPADRFGLLYASESTLVFEYSSAPRKSIIESLLRMRRDEGGLDTAVRIPRAGIALAAVVATPVARRWLALDPHEARERMSSYRLNPLAALLAGTVVAVSTQDGLLAFDTPENRRWEKLLRRD